MSRLRKWPVYTLTIGFLSPFLLLSAYLYFVVEIKEPTPEVMVADSRLAIPTKSKPNEVFSTSTAWGEIYPDTKEMKIGDKVINVSIADSWPERIKGLSNTPYLPEDVVKLFVFESLGLHSFWMKDMQYAIDIIWLNQESQIVSIKENATPESYPASFAPAKEATYVIETVSGFVKKYNLTVGDILDLPEID